MWLAWRGAHAIGLSICWYSSAPAAASRERLAVLELHQ
jgi:hypothetical protein